MNDEQEIKQDNNGVTAVIGYIGVIIIIGFIIVVGFLLFSNRTRKNCDFVAAYEATKNPRDSVRKQENIYNEYLKVCRGSSFNYELWKLENNIPED